MGALGVCAPRPGPAQKYFKLFASNLQKTTKIYLHSWGSENENRRNYYYYYYY